MKYIIYIMLTVFGLVGASAQAMEEEREIDRWRALLAAPTGETTTASVPVEEEGSGEGETTARVTAAAASGDDTETTNDSGAAAASMHGAGEGDGEGEGAAEDDDPGHEEAKRLIAVAREALDQLSKLPRGSSGGSAPDPIEEERARLQAEIERLEAEQQRAAQERKERREKEYRRGLVGVERRVRDKWDGAKEERQAVEAAARDVGKAAEKAGRAVRDALKKLF
jgi:hypothetical protein